MQKKRIKLYFSYNGQHYYGWQRQKNVRTIQGEIESALATMHKYEMKIVGSGRTDRGVHAYGQVAHCDTTLNIASERFAIALNSFLPHDIVVLASEYCSDVFHARHNAVRRTYHYYCYHSTVMQPHYNGRAYYIREAYDIVRLNSLARIFLGMHDFSSFASLNAETQSMIRTVYESIFFMHNGFLVYRITANAFLWHMVRKIVGSILQYAYNNKSFYDLKEVLQAKDARRCIATAPAEGLYLYKVWY